MNLTIVGYWGAYPERSEATSSYLLEEEGFYLLIDCGSGCLSQLQNYISLNRLNAVILSHYHHDHVADVGPLQYALLVHSYLGAENIPLSIYAPAHDEARFQSLTYRHVTVARPIEAGKEVAIGPWKVSFCQTTHPVYCLAMKFQSRSKTFVYTADTSWSPELVSFARGADLLLCEASLYDEEQARQSGHMSPSMAGRLARKAEVAQLVLTHFPHFGDHQELLYKAQEAFGGKVMLAQAGLTFQL